MKLHQEHTNMATAEARYSIGQLLSVSTQQDYGRIKRYVGVAVLAISGLPLGQVAMAVSLPQNVVSTIVFNEIDTSGNVIVPEVSFNQKIFNTDPSPHVITEKFNVIHDRLVGTGYADAQGLWGHSLKSEFINDRGALATSFYIANFEKENDGDVLTTRISNTKLKITDFGSQFPDDLFASFGFVVTLLPGALDTSQPIAVNPAVNPSAIIAFAKDVTIQGRAGRNVNTSNDPFSEPFLLSGDHDFFTGDYNENDPIFVSEATYDLDTVEFELALDVFDPGEEFTVVWQAVSLVTGRGGETFAEVQFWDPIGGTPGSFFEVGPSTSPVPVPTAVWLFGTGLAGLIGVGSRNRKGKA